MNKYRRFNLFTSLFVTGLVIFLETAVLRRTMPQSIPPLGVLLVTAVTAVIGIAISAVMYFASGRHTQAEIKAAGAKYPVLDRSLLETDYAASVKVDNIHIGKLCLYIRTKRGINIIPKADIIRIEWVERVKKEQRNGFPVDTRSYYGCRIRTENRDNFTWLSGRRSYVRIIKELTTG